MVGISDLLLRSRNVELHGGGYDILELSERVRLYWFTSSSFSFDGDGLPREGTVPCALPADSFCYFALLQCCTRNCKGNRAHQVDVC